MKLSVGRGHVPAACRNYRSSISSFMPAVCRFAVGGDMSPPYKGCFVYRGAFFACGLRGAQRRGCAAVREERALRMRYHDRCVHRSRNDRQDAPCCHCEERSDAAISCRNCRLCTSLFMPTVCRFAVGGDMSPPYKGCFVYRGALFACGLRGAQRRGCAAVRDEGALRMRRAPCGYCGCVPYDLPTSRIVTSH